MTAPWSTRRISPACLGSRSGVAKRAVDSMAEAPRGAALELERLAYGMLAQTSEADEALKRFER